MARAWPTASRRGNTQEHLDNSLWQRLPDVPWGPRDMAGMAVHQGAMWVVGGWQMLPGVQHELFNDVWRLEDGGTWQQVLRQAPWQAAGCIALAQTGESQGV